MAVRPTHLPRKGPSIFLSVPTRLDRHRPGKGDSKRLVVGRDIRLSDEITACERLVAQPFWDFWWDVHLISLTNSMSRRNSEFC